MEAAREQAEDVNNTGAMSVVEEQATVQTSDPRKSMTPRRGLRQRYERPRAAGVSNPCADVNGASNSPQILGGRVLRDRSTRTVPAWLKEAKSEDEVEEELDTDAAVLKRRKVSNGKRKKLSEGPREAGLTGDLKQTTPAQDHKNVRDAEGLSSRKLSTQTQSKSVAGRSTRVPAKPICKTEPTAESTVVDVEKRKFEIKKKEEDSDSSDFELDVEPQFQELPNISSPEEENVESSDEDVPFKDDLNDQSYDPKGEREGPKQKRKLIKQKEKHEKELDSCPKTEIKIEGIDELESADEEVKIEEKHLDEAGGSRKRGRRKKDDKTPRLPKRRKKPPVQYVRCEMEGCGTVLAHPRYLQHHIKYQHLLKKKYVCPHPSCGRLFRLQKQLLRHAKHHTDQRDYICEYCARAFKSSHNLAVHRMIHTGEKPLQCEICGFTCRQKASLNWHMKKHDADATYQFSCSICGKKFEKKDCVVAHKAKSHPEVLIAEALAANAGALLTTPASLLELQGINVPTEFSNLEGGQPVLDAAEPPAVTQVENVTQQGHQVVVLGQDQSLHAMQVPVTIALSPIDPPSPADQTHIQLQMPVQFVQGPSPPQLQPLHVFSTQQQSTSQPHILQMSFQPVSQLQLQTASSTLVSSSQSQGRASSNESFVLDNSVMSSTTSNSNCLQQTDTSENVPVVWEHPETSSNVKQGWCTQADSQS